MNTIIYLIAHVIVTVGVYNIIETFFFKNRENHKLKYIMYSGYYIATSTAMIFFMDPNFNMWMNIICIFVLTQLYTGTQAKKILVALIVYTTTMVIDGAIYSAITALKIFDGAIVFKLFSNKHRYIFL